MPDDNQTPRVLDLASERIKRGAYVQDHAWKEPQDPFFDARPVRFPLQVLPPVIADYVSDQSERMGSDVGMAAMFALAGISSAIDDRIRIQPKRNDPSWRESSRIWVAAVGPPAIMKSPTLKAMMLPVKRQDMIWQDDAAAAAKQDAIEAKIHAKQTAAAINARAKGEHCDLPEPLEERERHHAMVEDHTVEGLRNALKNTARGTLIHNDELSGFFGSQDAYRDRGVNKDGPLYLELYDGGRKGFTRASGGTLTVPNWGASIVGGIQPEPMSRIGARLQDDGLLQRFNVFHAQACVEDHDRVRDRMVYEAYDDLFKRLFDIQPSESSVRFSDEAIETFRTFSAFVREIQGVRIFPLKLRSHISKWRGQFARYALLLHAVESAMRSRHPCDAEVSAATAMSVTTLFMRYLLPHARHFYEHVIGGDHLVEHVRWIAGWILDKRLESVDRRSIRQSYRGLRNATDEDIHDVMEGLELYEWVSPVGDRRPFRQWIVNPRVVEKFARKAAEIAKEKESTRELMSALFGEAESSDSP